jgi:mono/diheme cytochrome c family protein
MTTNIATAWLLVFVIGTSSAWAESVSDDVQNGRHLATLICATCHVAGPEQTDAPILRPPAPSLESIAKRNTTSIDSIRTFLISTHRDISNPNGMPNPEPTDFQLGQVTAYILSLRNTFAAQTAKPAVDQSDKPSAEAGTCRAEIVRLELVLSRARANRQVVGSAPETLAARLHRQPTLESVAQAATEAEKGIETALVLARKLEAGGMDPECTVMLKKVELPSGVR